jgi:hypothetical protein
MIADARREGEIFMKMRPQYIYDIVEENKKRNIQPIDSARKIASLRNASLPVPSEAEVAAEIGMADVAYGP